jgi:hypothetical protein
MIGAKKSMRPLLLLWLLFTLGFLIWSFVLVSVMFAYNTSPGFVAFVALSQLLNFCILARYHITSSTNF